MRSSRRSLLWACLVATAGCSTPGVVRAPEPAPRVPADVAPVTAASSSPSDTLSVAVHGPVAVHQASTVRFTATVANGSAQRYYFWWFAAVCARSGGCAPTSYVAIAEGEGKSDISLSFGADHQEKDLVVQVAEIDGRGRTGSSPEFMVEGPARRLGGGGGVEGFGAGVCDWFADSFYPHSGRYTDPFTGHTWERSFRRDYCGNRVSWDPNV
jgi:hypothetical protein